MLTKSCDNMDAMFSHHNTLWKKQFILGFQVCFHHIRIYFDLTHYEIKEKTQ